MRQSSFGSSAVATSPLGATQPGAARRTASRYQVGTIQRVIAAVIELAPVLLVGGAALIFGDAIPRLVLLTAAVLSMWIVAIRAPQIALAIVFAAAPWFQSVTDGSINVAMVDLITAGIAPVFLFRWLRSGPKFVAGPMVWAVVIYVFVCAAVTVATPYSEISVRNFVQMLLYVVGYLGIFGYCVRRPEDLSIAPWAYLLSVLVIAVAVLATGQMYVLQMHKNGVGSVLSIGVVIATHLLLQSRETRRGTVPCAILLAVLGAALILSASRGGWVGAACGIAGVLVMHRKLRLALQALAVLVVVIAIGWSIMPEERRDYAVDFNQKNWNIKARYISAEYAWQMFKESPLTGNGLQMRDTYDATNVVLLTLAESGVPGMLALGGVWVTFGACSLWMSRRIPRLNPYFNLLAIGAGVMVARAAHGMFDHYWARGLAVPWAGAGMLVMCWGAVVSGRVQGQEVAPALAGRAAKLKRRLPAAPFPRRRPAEPGAVA